MSGRGPAHLGLSGPGDSDFAARMQLCVRQAQRRVSARRFYRRPGYDFLRLDNTFSGRSGEKPACDGGASNLDYSTIPEGGPELIINVPYTIEGKVAVRYVDDSGGCSSDDAL